MRDASGAFLCGICTKIGAACGKNVKIEPNITFYLSDIINKAPTFTTKPQPYVREHKIGGGKRDENGKLYVEMDVGKPLLDIKTWTLLMDTGEISVA